LATGFATRNRRYSGNAIYITNRNRSATNGGIVSDTFLTSTNTAYNQRFNIPTWLGGDGDLSTNFFATSVRTGHTYQQRLFFFPAAIRPWAKGFCTKRRRLNIYQTVLPQVSDTAQFIVSATAIWICRCFTYRYVDHQCVC